MGQDAGQKAEYYFASKLNEKGIPHAFIDIWYDFDVGKCDRVEVKSTQLTIRSTSTGTSMGHRRLWRIGQFDFTSTENRDKQWDANVWVCFIIRHGDQFMLYGFTRAKNLNKKRYISIHKLRELPILSFDEWVKEIQ